MYDKTSIVFLAKCSSFYFVSNNFFELILTIRNILLTGGEGDFFSRLDT